MSFQTRLLLSETAVNSERNSSDILLTVEYYYDGTPTYWSSYPMDMSIYDYEQEDTIFSGSPPSWPSLVADRQWHTLFTYTITDTDSFLKVRNVAKHHNDGTKTIHLKTTFTMYVQTPRVQRSYVAENTLALTPINRNTTIRYYSSGSATGVPSAQTKLYGVPITLSSGRPYQKGYKFLGWDNHTSATTVVYNPGDTFSLNEDLNLYAVWELSYMAPEITTLSAYRSVNGVYDESGENVTTNWTYNKAKQYVNGQWVDVTETPTITLVIGNDSYLVSSNATTYTTINDAYSISSQYAVTLTISYSISGDTYSATRSTFISRGLFTMDVNEDGTAIAFGGAAPNSSPQDSDWKGLFLNDVNGTSDLSTALVSKGLAGKSVEEIITYILNNI